MGLKTVLVLSVSTLRMIFPGLPMPQDAQTPAGKQLVISLWSSQPYAITSKAQVSAPWDLKVKNPLKLAIDRPSAPAESELHASTPGVVSKTYWGGGESVADDQPRLTPPAPPKQSYPEQTYAYWPVDEKALKDEASAAGDYSLLSNYAGSTTVTLGKEQEFPAALELVGVTSKPDLTKPYKVEWKPVAGALAYAAICFGGNDKESIMWTSGSDPDLATGLEDRVLTADQVKSYLEKGVLLPATATSVTIPAGIFGSAKGTMLTVMAMGQDKVDEKNGVRTEVIVRSITTAPLSNWFEAPKPPPAPGS